MMRTTVSLADDVAAAVERVRRERSIGLSEAVNELVRAGIDSPRERKPFVQKTHPIGVMVDVSNIGEVLEMLDEYDRADAD